MNLIVDGLAVAYGRRAILHDIGFTAHAGEMLALVGPNGSGKTTLLRAIAGHVAHAGQCRIASAISSPARVGYMPQDNATRCTLTVTETILLGRLGQLGLRVTPDDLEAVGALIDRFGLAALAHRSLAELSGGQRQLTFLAQALAGNPAMLLLDEPLSALDICHQLTVMDAIAALTRDQPLLTIIVLHDLGMAARYADRILVLHEGRLMACAAPETALTATTIAAAFDIEAQIVPSPVSRLLIEPLAPRSGVTGAHRFR